MTLSDINQRCGCSLYIEIEFLLQDTKPDIVRMKIILQLIQQYTFETTSNDSFIEKKK